MENLSTKIKDTLQNVLSILKIHKTKVVPALLLLVYAIVFYIIYFVYPSSFEKYSVITNIVFVILALLFFFYFLMSSLQGQGQGQGQETGTSQPSSPFVALLRYIKFSSLFILSIVAVIGLIYLISTQDGFSYLLTFLVNVGIILLVLSLLYVAINKIPLFQRLKQNGVFRYLYQTLGFIVTWFISSFAFLKSDIENTPSFILKISLFLVLFLVAYFTVPILLEKLYHHNANVLLDTPKYLDETTILGKYEDFKDAPKTNDEIFNHNYNYGLSAWFFIDEQQPNHNENATVYTPLLDYGNKPKILYNVEKHSLKITMRRGSPNEGYEDIQVYETNELPLQKWNYIVVNYTSGVLDVFINGVLVATENNIMPYMTYDNVSSGSENGVSGGITNVLYFTSPLSKSTITRTYSLLRKRYIPNF